MAKKQNPFVDHVLERLKPHGPITARAMFGGYGINYRDMMFACIVENVLFFRVDDRNRSDYISYGSYPFVYDGGKRLVEMPYLSLPDEIFNSPKQLKEYILKAYDATLRYRLKHPKKKRTKPVRNLYRT